MKRSLNIGCLVLLCVAGASVQAQVQNDPFGNHWLTLPGPGVGSFTVGSTATTGSALNVRGDLMGTPTGEVFRRNLFN